MEFSKLYVVDSVFITVLKITKCKNSKRKRMAGSFRRKKSLFCSLLFLLSLCIRHISRSACLWLREKMPDSKSFLHGENIVPSWEKKSFHHGGTIFSPYRNDLVLVDKDINPSKDWLLFSHVTVCDKSCSTLDVCWKMQFYKLFIATF